MAENETSTSTAELEFNVRIEDAGPGTKKVHVEVPAGHVAAKIAEQYKELRQEAVIRGFRKGHAPQRLIEKRFSSDVREQVRRALISESFEKAMEQNSLQILGEPEFDDPDKIELRDDAPLTYSFSVEVQPTIELPDLTQIRVTRPRITVTEQHIDQALMNLREQQGTMLPVNGRGVEPDDFVNVDIHVRLGNEVISHAHNARVRVRPGTIAGIRVNDLDKQLAGAMPEELRTLSLTVPDDYPNESLRGKPIEIDITIREIKRLQPAEINAEFLDGLGFRSEAELRQALREQMMEKIDSDIRRLMRMQVRKHLIDNVAVELPAKLSERQTRRVVERRAAELLERGVAPDRVNAMMERLKVGAAEEGAAELKAFFILQEVCRKFDIDVTEAEMNSRIATLAMQLGQRPERFKQELGKDQNMFRSFYIHLCEEKALDKILESARVEEVEPTAEQQSAASAGGESSAT
jgi:trigger factor